MAHYIITYYTYSVSYSSFFRPRGICRSPVHQLLWAIATCESKCKGALYKLTEYLPIVGCHRRCNLIITKCFIRNAYLHCNTLWKASECGVMGIVAVSPVLLPNDRPTGGNVSTVVYCMVAGFFSRQWRKQKLLSPSFHRRQ